MSREVIGLIGIVVLIVMILFRYWVGAAMAIVGFAGVWCIRGFEQACGILSMATFTNLSAYTVSAVPMFALMGMVIAETNIGRNLYRAAYRFVGRFRGGMASATVTACGILGAITGAEDVAAVIVTKVAMPQMRELGYDDELSTAAIAAGSPLANIIPPSLGLILYGMLTETSVAKLFIGGIIPGIMLVAAFCFSIFLVCRRRPELGPEGPRFSAKEKLQSLLGVLPVLLLFLMVLGGIYTGVCTSTEAGSVGAMGAIVIAFVTKQMNMKKFIHILREAVVTMGIILFLIAGTYIFIQFLNTSCLPQLITRWITATFHSAGMVMFMVGILYIILGMAVPQMCMMILTIPLLWPTMQALGFNYIFFGVFVTMMQGLGAVSPPVGMVSYMVAGMSDVPATKTFRGLIPFMVAYILVIAVICVFPVLVTWLPGFM